MKLILQIFIAFVVLSTPLSAQENTASENALAYLKNNGTAKQYEFAYEQLLKMLGTQYPETEANQRGWQYLNTHKDKFVMEIMVQLAPVYEKNFTVAEIKVMNTFYQSEAGQQLLRDRTQMTEKQRQALNDFYGSTVGEKIIEKQPVLTKEISEISEGWSRDLYQTALSLVK